MRPTEPYIRDINLLRFPLGVGISKVGAVGKKDFPFKLAAQLWGYTPPPNVRPVMPVLETNPNTAASPCSWVSRSTSPSVQPA